MSNSAAKMFFKINFTQGSRPTASWQVDEWEKARAFYTCNADYNYFKYALNGEKVVKNKDYMSYMQRADEDGNAGRDSTGAFGLKGEYTKEELASIKKKLQATSSNIWHGFISFNADLSKNFNNQQDCIDYLRPTFNTLIENSHLDKKNITAIFCLHDDTNNRHIHFQFFENQPTRVNKKGEIGYTKKGTVAQEAIDNFLVASGLYFEDSKYQLSIARDEAMDKLKEVAPTARSFGSNRYADGIKHKLLELAQKLPATGRTAYRSSNMKELRPEVDKVVNYIVNSDEELRDKVFAYYNTIEARKTSIVELMKSQKFAYIKSGIRLDKEDMEIVFDGKQKELDPAKMEEWVDYEKIKVIEKLHEDLRARLGNYVIGLAKSYKYGSRSLSKRFTSRNNKSFKIAAKQRRKYQEQQLDQTLKNIKRNGFRSGERVQTNFSYDLHRVEREIEMEQYEGGSKEW